MPVANQGEGFLTLYQNQYNASQVAELFVRMNLALCVCLSTPMQSTYFKLLSDLM